MLTAAKNIAELLMQMANFTRWMSLCSISSPSTTAVPHLFINNIVLNLSPPSLYFLFPSTLYLNLPSPSPQLTVVSFCSDEGGELKSQEGFMQTVRSVNNECKRVERIARMVADGCTDDKMKRVRQHLLHHALILWTDINRKQH